MFAVYPFGQGKVPGPQGAFALAVLMFQERRCSGSALCRRMRMPEDG